MTFQQGNICITVFPSLFTAKELDSEPGLYYYGARYLNPRTSRWISSDPAGFELINPMENESFYISGSNWYSYVNNDPVNRIDPLGLIDSVAAMDALKTIGVAGLTIPDPVTSAIGAVALAYVVVDSATGGKLTEIIIDAFSGNNESTSYPPRDNRPAANKPNIIPPTVAPLMNLGDPGDLGGSNFKPPKNIGPGGVLIVTIGGGALIYDNIRATFASSPEISESEEDSDNEEIELRKNK